jgi:acetyltransferase-like isoleucine patch superfamily enzyme
MIEKTHAVGNNSKSEAHLIQCKDGATFTLGDRSYIGAGTKIHNTVLIEIGDDVMISWDCLIMDTDMHSLIWEERADDVLLTVNGQTDDKDWSHVTCNPVRIKDKVWIGARCIICAGTTIEEGAVIAAGSVVRGYVAPYCLYGGNPAKLVRRLK